MKTTKERVKEKCVDCGDETPYYKDEHIDTRMCYVKGAGQLCTKCYANAYDKK